MRPCSVALTSFLNSAANLEVVQIDLYTFALTSGEVLRYSGGDTALTVPAAGFPAGSINAGARQTFALGPRFGRSKTIVKIGVEPSELDIEILAGADELIGTLSFAEAVRIGIFDGATVELDRLFAPPPAPGSGTLDTSLGTLLWFHGRVADSDVGRSRVALKVKSLVNLLAIQQMPRRLYGASCTHVFGDAMCGYDRFAGKNALGASTGNGQITVTSAIDGGQGAIIGAASVPTVYNEGTVIGATGANAGFTRTICNITGARIGIFKAFLFPIAIGDTFTLLPGCDHTANTCLNSFNNLQRFGGFPHIPPPELAL